MCGDGLRWGRGQANGWGFGRPGKYWEADMRWLVYPVYALMLELGQNHRMSESISKAQCPRVGQIRDVIGPQNVAAMFLLQLNRE